MKGKSDPDVEIQIAGLATPEAQRFLLHVRGHPWFRTVRLMADIPRRGAFGSLFPWRLSVPRPESLEDLRVEPLAEVPAGTLVFSFLDEAPAREWEPRWAAGGAWVVSTSAAHRLHEAVPVLVPEVNADHLRAVEAQRDWSGVLLAGPSPVVGVLALVLGVLRERFALDRMWATVSVPSPAGPDPQAAIRFPDERQLIRAMRELSKILGWVRGRRLASYPLESGLEIVHDPGARTALGVVYLEGGRDLTSTAARRCWESFRPPELIQTLPSTPPRLLTISDLPAAGDPGPADPVVLGRIRGRPGTLQFVFMADLLGRMARTVGQIGELAVRVLAGGGGATPG